MNFTIRELTTILKGQLILGDPRLKALRAVVDSRQAKSGDLFFALKGERVDGHQYAMDVCQAGAVGVVVSDLEWLSAHASFAAAVIRVTNPLEALQRLGQVVRQRFKGKVIGITGSNGKTTTKQMLTNIMKTTGPGLSTPGNYNSQIGLPLALSELDETAQWMVLEMGASEPGNIAALADIAQPQIGILTGIGAAHLATFGSLENVAKSKWELMESLPRDGTAILPWGEPLLEPLIRAYGKKIIFFGEDSACPVRATSIENKDHVSFLLHVGSQSTKVTLPVPGKFNVLNALASAAAAWVMGIPIESIVEGLSTFEPPKMRMELLTHSSGAFLINDAYNANPTSMVNAVRSMVESFPGKTYVAVLGSMLELGIDSEKLHFHVGSEVAHFPLDKIYLYGDETSAVMEGIVAGGMSSKKISHMLTHEDLIQKIKEHLKSGTIILFKGSRSMRLEQVIEKLVKGKN